MRRSEIESGFLCVSLRLRVSALKNIYGGIHIRAMRCLLCSAKFDFKPVIGGTDIREAHFNEFGRELFVVEVVADVREPGAAGLNIRNYGKALL